MTNPFRPGKTWRYVIAALALQTAIAGLMNFRKLQAPAPGSPTRVDDTDLYYRYATMVSAGKVPYRDFLVEYPPLALPLFLAPRTVSRGLHDYKLWFAAEMLLWNALTVCLVAGRDAGHEGPDPVISRLAWYTLFFGLLSRYIVARYDAASMFVGFAASVWLTSGRERLGGSAAGLGTLMKYYPALLVFVASARGLARPSAQGRRAAIWFLLTVGLGLSFWVAVGGVGGVRRTLSYHVERGFEYGSLYAGVQMLFARAAGAEIVVTRDHASYSSFTRWTPYLLPLVFPIQAVSVLLVEVVYHRRGNQEGLRYGAAAVLAFIISGKVFSPQFLIWLMPFLASLDGPVARRCRWIFAAGCVATLVAPSGTSFFPRTSLWVVMPYNLKNGLFLWLFLVLLCGPPARGMSAEAGASGLPRRDGGP